LSKEVGRSLYIKGESIYLTAGDIEVVFDYSHYTYPELLKRIKNFINNDNGVEFSIKDKIEYLIYHEFEDKDVNDYISRCEKSYVHKSLICILKDDFKSTDHGYIVGLYNTDIKKSLDILGIPKTGYSYYIIDGKFIGCKELLDNKTESYLIGKDYPIKHSDGITEIEYYGIKYQVKHIRRSI
jgi:hypothetical protein